MEAKEIIKKIQTNKKKTPVKVFVQSDKQIKSNSCQVFSSPSLLVGEWDEIKKVLDENKDNIYNYCIEESCRNSALPLTSILDISARIEPGAIIREEVAIGKNAVIMMGAIINIGTIIGDKTMIDMGAIIGARAIIGKNCHIGAGAVIAGVIEPISAKSVVIEDNVLIGANAVILEGIHIEEGAIIGAGAVVTKDVPKHMVVAGNPARIIKRRENVQKSKIKCIEEIR